MADNWESLEGYSKIEEMYGVTVKFIVNKTTRKDEVEKTESTYLEKVKNTMKKLNYEIYTKPYILNIVGIRSKTRVANKFDDKLVVFYTDEKGSEVVFSKTTEKTGNGKEYFDFTTDPGITVLEKWSSNEKGCAILKANQYIDTWVIGKHQGKYEALKQNGYVHVYRDSNKDNLLDLQENTVEKRNNTGINIHKPWKDCKTKQTLVKNISAGCQVFADPFEFDSFMKLAKIQVEQGKTKFTYTLIHEEDLK